jgi:hypothetical protein
MMTKTILKKKLHTLDNNASGVQVGDIAKRNCLKLVDITI